MTGFDADRLLRMSLSNHWSSRFQQFAPEVSTTVRVRLAWRLAAELIATDDELERLSLATMTRWPETGQKCRDLRDIYLRRVARAALGIRNGRTAS